MTTTNDPMNSTTDLLNAGKEAKENATKLWSSVRAAASLVEKAAKEQLQERPYTTLGVVAGAGFVVAGGLASSITKSLVSAGTKLAAVALFDQLADAITPKSAAPSSTPSTPDEGAPQQPDDADLTPEPAAI